MAALVAVVAILAIGGCVLAFLNWKESRSSSATPDAPQTGNRPGVPEGELAAPPSTPTATRPKAREDLKFGSVTLEKGTWTSLVYAIGTITNDSTHLRYGVRVEVALTDGSGKPAGIAKDYRDVMEPGEAWRFRALILDSKARAGSVQLVAEDE